MSAGDPSLSEVHLNQITVIKLHFTLRMMLVTLAAIICLMKGVYSVILQSKLALASHPLAACNIMLSISTPIKLVNNKTVQFCNLSKIATVWL